MGSTGLSVLLRGALGAAGGLGFLLGLVIVLAGEPAGGSWILVASVVLILVALYEQGRYRARAGGTSAAPSATVLPGQGRYQRTDEVFDDPTTGQRLRVWFDPVTGDRRYVPEP